MTRGRVLKYSIKLWKTDRDVTVYETECYAACFAFGKYVSENVSWLILLSGTELSGIYSIY